MVISVVVFNSFSTGKSFSVVRALARFFCTEEGAGGGLIASGEGTSFVGGSGGIRPQKVSNLEAPKRCFLHFQEICN